MLLGVALERLEDPDNARAAYERSLALDPQEPLAHLNYGESLAASWVVTAAGACRWHWTPRSPWHRWHPWITVSIS